MTDRDRELLRSTLVPQMDDILWEAGELGHVEEVERMASELLLAFGVPGTPADLAGEIVTAIECSEAPAAPDLLAGFAALGVGEVARCAAQACERRGERARVDRIGQIELRAAAYVLDGEAGCLQLRFERTRTGQSQLAALFIHHVDDSAAVVSGMLAAPAAEELPFMGSEHGAEPESITPDEARARAHEALARTAALDLAVDRELGVGLPLIARGLTGSADGLPAVAVDLLEDDDPGPLHVDPLDEDAFALVERGLLEELREQVQARGQEGAEAEHAEFFASALLQWKWGYADGRLGTWTCDDVAGFLLDYMPRKMPTDDETLSLAPGGVKRFLRFLDQRQTLVGDPLQALEGTVDELTDALVEAANDPGNWGMAKSLVSAMDAEGIEVTDQEALEAWMADFNSRPWAERDRVLGPALEGTPAPAPEPLAPGRAGNPGASSKQERRGKRKQARAARKRNRR